MCKKYNQREIEEKLKERVGKGEQCRFLAFDEFGRIVYERDEKPVSFIGTISKEDLGL